MAHPFIVLIDLTHKLRQRMNILSEKQFVA